MNMEKTTKKKKNISRTIAIIAVAILVVSFIISQTSKRREAQPIVSDEVQLLPIEARVKGNTEATLSLVEYSDFQCPFCSQVASMIDELVANYGNQFRFEYRHLPLRSIHPNAQIASQASEAAGIQGKFWEMHDILFAKQKEWSTSINPKKLFRQYAEEIGINPERFSYDLESDEVKAKVNADYDQATALGIKGTPSFLVNGKVATIEEFLALINLEDVQTQVNSESTEISE